MANLIISADLAERLANLAVRENRPIEAVLKTLLDSYQNRAVEKSQQTKQLTLSDFPVDDLGPWPEGLTLRREELYGDNGR